MTKVFISYSRKDKAFAEKLNTALEEIGLDSWIDWIDIPPTADWWDQVQKGIESADAFLFLLSPDSIISEVCGREFDHAIKNGKRLIPLVARDVKSRDVHDALRKLNWIYFREQDDFEASLKKLEAGIKTDLLWVESHRRLQVRAIEWEKRNDRSLLLRGKDLREAEEQLANVGQKDPQPTDLQRQYVLEGRRRERQIRNTLLTVGGVVLIILAILSIFAFNQRNIALARELATRAQSMSTSSTSEQTVAALLSIESMKLYPTDGAANYLISHDFAGKLIASMTHDSDNVISVAFSPDGKYVVSGGDTTARIWEAMTGKEIARMPHDSAVNFVAFSRDGKYVVSASDDSTVHVWEVATAAEVASMKHDSNVTSVAFSPDGKYVVSGSLDGTARVWETQTGKELSRLTVELFGVSSVAFSPDGKYVASGSGEHTASVWEAKTGREVARMTHDGMVWILAFSPDRQYVVSADEISVRVWEAHTGQEVARLNQDNVVSVDFSPDGKYVVLGGGDGTASVWEIATGKKLAQALHDINVTTVAFSPDGKYVVSGGDATARVWEAATGKELARTTHDGLVFSASFSPNGKYVVSGGGTTVRVWSWLTPDLIGNACARLPRNLSRAEWQQYIGNALSYRAVCENLPTE